MSRIDEQVEEAASGEGQGRLAPALDASANELRHLLLRLLGDYWLDAAATIPSSALVDLMADFGVSPHGSRAALARLTKRGLLISTRRGRRTYYGLTNRAVEVLSDGAHRFARFGSGSQAVDGRWRVVAFSVPESRRSVRHVLRERLRWHGFAPLYDGMWVSPRGSLDAVTEALAELEVATATVMYATLADGSPPLGHPIKAWDLPAVHERYAEFVETWSPWVARVKEGAVNMADALRVRTEIVGSWREFPSYEPDLPEEYLPIDWLRGNAREVFIAVYDGLGPLAELRVGQVVSSYTDDPQATPHFHTVADLEVIAG